MNLGAVKLRLQRQDGEFEEKIGSKGKEGKEREVGQQWRIVRLEETVV